MAKIWFERVPGHPLTLRFSVFLLRAAGWGLAFGGMSSCTTDLAVRRHSPASVSTFAALQVIIQNPSFTTPASANPDRRQAAAVLIDRYGPDLLAAPGKTVSVPATGGGSVRLSLRRGLGLSGISPAQFASLQAADDYRVRSASGLVRVPGPGVPLVATMRPVLPVSVAGPVPKRAVAGIARAVTALPIVYRNRGNKAPAVSFDLYDPHDATPPLRLAADYSTPLAVTFTRFAHQKRGLRGFLGFGPDDFSSAGLYATETPTPDKTPLVLVHGLISDPTDFHDLHNRLESDPETRRRYQVWLFYYPTSLPVPYSATELREDLELFIHQLDPGGTHPALHRAVLVGHSMGGLLCRLTVSDGGDRYYGHFFRKPIDELHVRTEDGAQLRRTFYDQAAPDVAQVVFIATPHRGSRLTGGTLGLFGRLLVRVPPSVRTQVQRIMKINRAAFVPDALLKPASSIKSLSPRDPVILALNDLPTRPGVKLHSILGDRGRGGPRERSSDGVVPYESSHLPQAESEILVPAGHNGTLRRPETAAEIVRILHQAARNS